MSDELRTVTIFSLPNELLETIAAAGQEDRVANLYSSYRDHRLNSYEGFRSRTFPKIFKSERTLSHVSRRFREIIVGAAALWTIIEAHWSERTSMKLFELYLQRSKALKISVTLRGSEQCYAIDRYGRVTAISTDDAAPWMSQGAALAQVVKHAHRIKALRIELITENEVEVLRSFPVVAAAPYLQHLEIMHVSHSWEYDGEEVTISLFSSTPRLRFLKIDGFQLQLPTAPWTMVTHLELRRFSSYQDSDKFGYFPTITAECPLLVHLRVHIFFAPAGKDQIHIPTLKFLHVWIAVAGEDASDLLHAVNLFDTPALTEFVVEGTHGDMIYTFLNSTGRLRSSFPALTSFVFISEDVQCSCDNDIISQFSIDRGISPRSFAPFPALFTLTLINQCFTSHIVQDLLGPESLPWPLLRRLTLCPTASGFDDVRSALRAAMDFKRQSGQPFPETKLFNPLQSPENWHDSSFAAVEVEVFDSSLAET
ncbi:hypothetical protein C8R45DRAFT_1220126 [Mycena sanguinolenta]|nr:hypothetical protein C8R45DRAFT_1220126 [Mycena sanguinolenta]